MLPIFDYGRQISHTDVKKIKKQGLPQMSANRPSIWFTGDEIPLSLSLPRPLQASPVCEALQLYQLWVRIYPHVRPYTPPKAMFLLYMMALMKSDEG